MKTLDNQLLTNVYGLVQDYIMWDYKVNEGYTYSQVAQLMGICEQTVYRTIRAARKLEMTDEQSFDDWVTLGKTAYDMLAKSLGFGRDK